MYNTIVNPERDIYADHRIVKVRQYQAIKGMTLVCTIDSDEEADGKFTEGLEYPVVNGFRDYTITGPVGYDEADVLDDDGDLIRVILDPNNEVVSHAGLFEIVDDEFASKSMKEQDADHTDAAE